MGMGVGMAMRTSVGMRDRQALGVQGTAHEAIVIAHERKADGETETEAETKMQEH